MTDDEKRQVLADCLARLRAWPYERLAAAARGRAPFVFEGAAADGTAWVVEVTVCRDDDRRGTVRAFADLSTAADRPLLPFLPLYRSAASGGFLMAPDGSFVGE